jgi:RNA polymerase sigma factor (sigma-70 family)
MKKNGQFDISKDVFIRNEKAYKSILSERSFEMLRLRTLEDMTYISIAKLYGVSTSRIRQICARSVDKIEQARYEVR